MEKTLILIDGAFLSKLSRYFGGGKYLKFNIITFCKSLAEKQNLICEHIYYYTAPPFLSDKPNKEELRRYEDYKKFIRKISQDKIISIREGRCQRLKVDGKFVYGQKGVDALVIIDLMSIPIEHREVKKVVLIANDSDFVPVVEKLKQLGVSILLYTYFSKNRKSSFSRSNELLKTATKYLRLIKEDFEKFPLG